MAKIKGQKEYEKWEKDHSAIITMKQAFLIQCYICNGMDEGGVDCGGISCPFYQFHPYNKNKLKKKRNMTDEQRKLAGERLRKAREKR